MIKSGREYRGVVLSVYQMGEFDCVEWHSHSKPHTIETIRGRIVYEIEREGGGNLEPGAMVMLPAYIRHRFFATKDDTIVLTMMESEGGPIGEAGGVLLEKADS